MEDTAMVQNAVVYGLEESIRGAKLPMATDTGKLTGKLTPGIDRLGRADIGEGHDNWLSGIVLQCDLRATVKFWTEFERYHFAQIVSSQSTMHRISRFDLDEQYIQYVDPRIVEIMKEKVAAYNQNPTAEGYLEILYSNPAGCFLTARITTNYRQLKTMYLQRKDHRLPEWRHFCQWMEGLPHSEWIMAASQDKTGSSVTKQEAEVKEER